MKFLILISGIFALTFTSCNQNPDGFLEYRMHIEPTDVKTDTRIKTKLVLSENTNWLVSLFDSVIVWQDFTTGEIVKSISYNSPSGKIFDFAVEDTSSFIVFTDSNVIYHKKGKEKVFELKKVTGDFLVIPNFKINYCYQRELLFLRGINHYFDVVGTDKTYECFGVLNLRNGKFDVLELKIPEQYTRLDLSVPGCFVSSDSNYLVVSFEYDENVSLIDLNDFSIKSFELSPKLNYNSYNPGKTKKSRKDAMQVRENTLVSNAKAFYNSEQNELIRMYSPKMPRIKADGSFYSYYDVPVHILSKNLKTGLVKKYMLPSGIFYGKWLWKYEPNVNQLKYLKIIRNENNFFSNRIYSIELFNY